MLDLILVIPDRKLSDFETTRIETSPQWDTFNPITRTASQFHGANRLRFPSHYRNKLENMGVMEIAKLQRSASCPVLYFPLFRLPRTGVNLDNEPKLSFVQPRIFFQNQSRDLWCKYGVISESDLIADLVEWEPFHFAGRFHKAVSGGVNQSS